jgi:hypothetical protein
MYKLLYFFLVVALTVAYIATVTISTPNMDPRLPLILSSLVALGGSILTLVWGLRTKAGTWRIVLATLFSFIPFFGPWIAFFILLNKTPKYTGKLTDVLNFSMLWRAALALLGLWMIWIGIARVITFETYNLPGGITIGLIGALTSTFCIGSIFKARWARAAVIVSVGCFLLGSAMLALSVFVGMETVWKVLLGLAGAAGVVLSLGYLLMPKWVTQTTLPPVLFAVSGLLLAIYGWFGTSARESTLTLGIGGIATIALSLGYLLKARWARLIVGILAALLGLAFVMLFLIPFFSDPTVLMIPELGGYSLTLAFLFFVGLGGGLIYWGGENIATVFRRKEAKADASSGPLSSVELVASYLVALQTGDKPELARIFGQRVGCDTCGAIVLAKDAWLVRQNGDLICPKCSQVWAQTVKTS